MGCRYVPETVSKYGNPAKPGRGSMLERLIPYLDHRGQLIGLMPIEQALALADVRVKKRRRDGAILGVKDRRPKLSYRGIQVVSRSVLQGNSGTCYEQELSCHRVYALRGKGI